MTPHIAMANGKEPVVGVAPDIHDEDMPQLRKSYDETDEEGLVHVEGIYNDILEVVKDEEKAMREYKAVLRMRRDTGMDRLLRDPYEKYPIMKQGTPFYIYGRARDGSVVAYQLSGRICPKHLSAHGVKQDDIWKFTVFHIEFITELLQQRRTGEKTVTIMDMRGLTFFKASNLYYLRLARWYAHALLATAGVCVNRVGPILVVHAPLGESMGGVMKRLLMAVLPHAYASKLEFVDVHRLQEWVHPDELHVDYGGNNTTPLEESHDERAILHLLQQNRQRHLEEAAAAADEEVVEEDVAN